LSRRELHAIPDTEILRALLPEALYERGTEAGLSGMYALSFALRARVSYLAALSHLASFEGGAAELAGLPSASAEVPEERAADFETVLSFPWRRGVRLPILGFAANGLYVVPATAGQCRAFDAYDLYGCAEAQVRGAFCEGHQAERWWGGGGGEDGTAQAKMFAFYSSRESFSAYDEGALSELVSDFLRKLGRVQFDSAEVSEALKAFSFASERELQQAGPLELRRRFRQRALVAHPDRGGEGTDFVQLRRRYDVLKLWLRGRRDI
jgi:hypothetical protein